MTQEILNSIDVLPANANYWFIRTDGGQYFETFFNNEFIGINWNDITLSDLGRPVDVVKDKIYRTQKLDKKLQKDRKRATDIYNKLIRFKDLKRNDVVVIPSENSELLGFGIIADDAPFELSEEKFDCPYLKRRKIKWIVDHPKRFDSVDDVFYKIRKSRHAISSVDAYASQIDSAMYNVYKKQDKSHFVVNVKSSEEINWLLLAEMLKEMHFLMSEVNKAFNLREDMHEGTIQIALQSPGFFNLGHKGFSLILLAALLGASGCSDVEGSLPKTEKKKFEQFKSDYSTQIDSTKSRLNKIDVQL